MASAFINYSFIDCLPTVGQSLILIWTNRQVSVAIRNNYESVGKEHMNKLTLAAKSIFFENRIRPCVGWPLILSLVHLILPPVSFGLVPANDE